ncbi:uncharacterized protein LOC117286896 [Fukomys damarensis]|uniref:uncharacterized protein LOC117286896 n=1 Tax=Fukomys damarensis TaxID=885580 RepID=UPI001455C2F0|nr:uncharacterized protein LOC117286896 [Fukomys damarensis]
MKMSLDQPDFFHGTKQKVRFGRCCGPLENRVECASVCACVCEQESKSLPPPSRSPDLCCQQPSQRWGETKDVGRRETLLASAHLCPQPPALAGAALPQRPGTRAAWVWKASSPNSPATSSAQLPLSSHSSCVWAAGRQRGAKPCHCRSTVPACSDPDPEASRPLPRGFPSEALAPVPVEENRPGAGRAGGRQPRTAAKLGKKQVEGFGSLGRATQAGLAWRLDCQSKQRIAKILPLTCSEHPCPTVCLFLEQFWKSYFLSVCERWDQKQRVLLLSSPSDRKAAPENIAVCLHLPCSLDLALLPQSQKDHEREMFPITSKRGGGHGCASEDSGGSGGGRLPDLCGRGKKHVGGGAILRGLNRIPFIVLKMFKFQCALFRSYQVCVYNYLPPTTFIFTTSSSTLLQFVPSPFLLYHNVASRIMPPKQVHILIPGTGELLP